MSDPYNGETPTQHGIAGTAITTAVLTNVVVFGRLVVRKFVVKSLGWDDLAIFLALCACNVGTALVLVQVHYGFGKHHGDIPAGDYIEYQRFSYLEWIQTFQTLMLTKIAICLLLLRIVISRSFTYTLWLWVALLLISNIVVTFLWIAQCRPVQLAWQKPLEPGSCFSESELLRIIFAQAIVSVVSDFILAAYPAFILRRLRMSWRRKLGLCMLMGLGVMTGTLCIARTVLNWQNVNMDSSWNVLPNWYLRSMEVFMGFIAACAPAMYPGYRWLIIWWQDGSHHNMQTVSSDKENSPPPPPRRAERPTSLLPPLPFDHPPPPVHHVSSGETLYAEAISPPHTMTQHQNAPDSWFVWSPTTPGDLEAQHSRRPSLAGPPRNFSRILPPAEL